MAQVGGFQPTKGFIVLSQSGAEYAHSVRLNISLLREFLQLVQDVLRLLAISSRGINISEECDEKRSALRQLNRLSRVGDSWLRLRQVCVREPKQ